eukprot:Hpha_TRINITY_DN8480_c0_g1::TRINITY_DN8480_c0_g1_i1::g.34603::m.34603
MNRAEDPSPSLPPLSFYPAGGTSGALKELSSVPGEVTEHTLRSVANVDAALRRPRRPLGRPSRRGKRPGGTVASSTLHASPPREHDTVTPRPPLWTPSNFHEPTASPQVTLPDTAVSRGAGFCGGSKPPLLTDMESYLAAELHKAAKGNPSERLRVYRGCLSLFISRSKVYGPLLSAVMREYDNVLAQYSEMAMRNRRAEALILRRKAVQEEEGQALERERSKMEAERAVVQQEHNTTTATLTAQVNELRDELATLKLSYSQLKQENKEEQSKVLTLVQAVREAENRGRNAQEKVGKLQREMSKTHHTAELYEATKREFDEYKRSMKGSIAIGVYEKVHSELESLQEQLRDLAGDKARLKRDLRVKSLDLKDVTRQLTEVRAEAIRMRGNNGDLTPRPRWADLTRGMGVNLKDRSSQSVAQDLLGAVEAKQKRCDEAQEEIKSLTYKFDLLGGDAAVSTLTGDMLVADTTDDYFVGLGSASHVPKCFQWHGRVANRRLGKGDVEDLIRQCWEKKGREGVNQGLGNFLYVFLLERYGDPQSVAEVAYSLRDGCIRYRRDPDCCTFLRILEGELPERLYGDERRLMEDLQARIMQLERQGRVKKKTLFDALTKWFPAKSQVNLNQLIAALHKDASGGSIETRVLFEEDEEGNQSAFVEALRAQFIAESTEYLTDVARAVAAAATERGDSWIITPQALQDAVLSIDPLKSEEELRDMITTGFELSWEESSSFPERESELDGVLRRMGECTFVRTSRKGDIAKDPGPRKRKSGAQSGGLEALAAQQHRRRTRTLSVGHSSRPDTPGSRCL